MVSMIRKQLAAIGLDTTTTSTLLPVSWAPPPCDAVRTLKPGPRPSSWQRCALTRADSSFHGQASGTRTTSYNKRG
eukprot:1132795-Pyramimonas_sp.AAC.1